MTLSILSLFDSEKVLGGLLISVSFSLLDLLFFASIFFC